MNLEYDELHPTRWSLIRRLKNLEDQESWRDFFETYWRLIYSVALKSGLSPQEAEEVVQNTVITVFKHIQAFKADPSIGSFKGWLLRVARSRINDQFRARPRNPTVGSVDQPIADSRLTRATPPEERVPDPGGNFVDAIWEDEWRKNLVHNALEQVKAKANARDFQIFYLYTIKEHDPKEVAGITGVSPSYVYVVKSRLMPVFESAVRALDRSER